MHSREVIALYYARCLAKQNNKRTREYSYPFNRLSSVRCEKRTSISWYIAALVVCVCNREKTWALFTNQAYTSFHVFQVIKRPL